MKKSTFATGIFLTVMWVLNVLTAAGQESVTKSGTQVTPADRLRATPLLLQKSAASLPDPTAGTYLVVTREDLLVPLEPLLEWKRQQGFRVETLIMTSRESDSIREALQARFDSATTFCPAQKYVLLVRDIDRLRSCQGRYTPGGLENSITDLYYGEYTGDYIPEAMVGRLSVADSAELVAVVKKTIAYEQGRWAAAERMLLTAGKETRANAPTTTNGQVRYLSELVAAYRPRLDTVCFYNPTSEYQLDTIVRALDHPNALINYTAHCTRQGWSNPPVGYTTVDTLQGAVPTVWVNNCCLSNSFGTTCFGERLLRNAERGAVAVIGATNETLWNEDYYWAVGAKYPPTENPIYSGDRPGAFDRVLIGGADSVNTMFTKSSGTVAVPGRYDADAVALGALNYAGCSAVTLVGSPYDAFYWETYCLLGDPSLSLMLGNADTLTLALAQNLGMDTARDDGSCDSLMAGMTSVAIVGSPWSRISATQKGVLLGTVLTDSSGHGTLLFNQGLTGDSLTLTATRPESIFKQLTIPIVQPFEGRLAVTNAAVNPEGSALNLWLKNVGMTSASNHRLVLRQTAEDTALGIAIGADSLTATIGLMESGEELLLTCSLREYTVGQLPLLLGKMALYDSLEEYATMPLALAMEDLRPRLSAWLLTNEVNEPVRVIAANQTYTFGATLAHQADSARLWVNDSLVAYNIHCDQLSGTFNTNNDTERLRVELLVNKDRWNERYSGWLLAHNNMEDFESGDWSNYPWQCNNLNPWQIDSSTAAHGHFCVRSAAIGHSQRSTMTLEIETLVEDSVVFYYYVSSEGSDWLYFFVDGRRRGYWSGYSGWQRYARFLPAGRHTLQWFYQKDASGSEREDCARIDDIRLPLAVWGNPYGHSVKDSVDVGISHFVGNCNGFDLWPNPAREGVTITHESRPYRRVLKVYDAYGCMVDEIKIADNCETTQYLTQQLRFGIYTLVLHDKTGRLVRKLIVTK